MLPEEQVEKRATVVGGRPTIRVAGLSTLEPLLCPQVALWPPELGGQVWSLCQ